MTVANSSRGEAEIAGYKLRPSFAALTAAEEELGPLFALVERAAAGELRMAEMVALFWHCRDGGVDARRSEFSEVVIAAGLAAATPALRILITQILGGR